MIHNYSDHAANERTFLAWVRTAIAVMAFGFLVARFNLILRIARQSAQDTTGHSPPVYASGFGNLAGVILIAAGTVIVTVAALRFVRTRRAIDSTTPYVPSARADLSLAALILVLSVAMVVYLSKTLIAGP